jgi:hypothetical protein
MMQLEEWESKWTLNEVLKGLEDKTERNRSIDVIVNFWEPVEVDKNCVVNAILTICDFRIPVILIIFE